MDVTSHESQFIHLNFKFLGNPELQPYNTKFHFQVFVWCTYMLDCHLICDKESVAKSARTSVNQVMHHMSCLQCIPQTELNLQAVGGKMVSLVRDIRQRDLLAKIACTRSSFLTPHIYRFGDPLISSSTRKHELDLLKILN